MLFLAFRQLPIAAPSLELAAFSAIGLSLSLLVCSGVAFL